MNLKNTTLLICFLFAFFSSYAQKNEMQNHNITRCYADEANAKLLEKYPTMMGSEKFEQILQEQLAYHKNSKSQSVVVTIPVVVHVLHNGEQIGTGANITDAQVISQITVLNEDYRRMLNTPGYNTDIDGADVEVEFCLAQQNPDGDNINGIDRINIGQDGIFEASLQDAQNQMDALKPSSIWDPSRYMNMWSVKYRGGSGILGYAQFPGGGGSTDGVVSDYRYFGSSDYNDGTFNLSAPFDKGRTMTHEVGHFLGLYHTFQGACPFSGESANEGDFCLDTPAVGSPNYGCPSSDSCATGDSDMVENYMDYTNDACMNIFTNDQKARVLAVLASQNNRASLTTSNVCQPGLIFDTDAMVAVTDIPADLCDQDLDVSVRITNAGNNLLTTATIAYNVDGGASQIYNWNGNLALNDFDDVVLTSVPYSGGGAHVLTLTIESPNNATDENLVNNEVTASFDVPEEYSTSTVTFTLMPDDYGSETTWAFTDGDGTVLYSGGPYANGNTNAITETFTINTTSCYTLTIEDEYGDGICCAYGDGSYALETDDASQIVLGGTFTDTISHTFKLGQGLSIEEEQLNTNLGLFPNPVSDVLTVTVAEFSTIDYVLYNALGQELKRGLFNQGVNSLTVSTYAKGVYFIKLRNTENNAFITKKLLVK